MRFVLPIAFFLSASFFVASVVSFQLALDDLESAVDELGASVGRWEAAVREVDQ